MENLLDFLIFLDLQGLHLLHGFSLDQRSHNTGSSTKRSETLSYQSVCSTSSGATSSTAGGTARSAAR